MDKLYLRPLRAYTAALTSGTSATITPAAGVGMARLRVVSSVDAWVSIGQVGTVAQRGAGNSVFMPAGHVEYFACVSGDVVAALPDTATSGVLNVADMGR